MRRTACGAGRPSGSGAASSDNAVGPQPAVPRRTAPRREDRALNPPTASAEFVGWPEILGRLVELRDLSRVEAASALGEILAGRATAAQIAGWIVAMRIKGESVDELVGLVDALMDVAEPLPAPAGAVDIVGTGGSPSRRKHALSVSTAASFVATAAGAVVCKHGNLRASATSGSFDTLNALGVNSDLGPDAVLRCIDEVGIGFVYARRFHPSVRHAGPVRSEIGIPTLFNVLGPLANPGRVRHHLIGTSDPRMARRMAEVLARRGSQRAWVVHGSDGLDEITTTGPTSVVELNDGRIDEWELDPIVLGIPSARPDDLAGGDPDDNARIVRAVLGGEPGHRADIVALNAAAGLVVAGVAADLQTALETTHDVLATGRALDVLDGLVELTSTLS